MPLHRPFPTLDVRIERLREYPAFDFAHLCGRLNIRPITLDSLQGVRVYSPRDGHDKWHSPLGRIKYCVKNWKKMDPILVSIGGIDGPGPDGRGIDEPFLFDGRHRFVAALLLRKETIRVDFLSWKLVRLSDAVIDYLTGKSDVKPK